MMQLCQEHDCVQWAQWRISGDTDRQKDVVMKLCSRHKEQAMEMPTLQNQRAVFAGAMPDLEEVKRVAYRS